MTSHSLLSPDSVRLVGELRPNLGPLLAQKSLRYPRGLLQGWRVFGWDVPRLLPLLDRLIVVGAGLACRRYRATSFGNCRRDMGVLIHTPHANTRKTSNARNSCNDTR